MPKSITMLRSKATIEFHCGRCNTDKASKSVGTWHKPDGTTVAICNGCYGNLLAHGHEGKLLQ